MDARSRSQLPSVVAVRRALKESGGFTYEFPSKCLVFLVCIPFLIIVSWMYMRTLYSEHSAYWVMTPKYLSYLNDGAEILYHYNHWLAPYYEAGAKVAASWEAFVALLGNIVHVFFRPNFFICMWRVWWCYGFCEGVTCCRILYHSGCDEPMTYGKYMTGCLFFGAAQRMPLEAQREAFRKRLLEAVSADMESIASVPEKGKKH